MTAFNRQSFIAEAIESVLASNYSNYELIILNDASTDKTYTIAASFAAVDSRIKLHSNATNLGQFATRNKIVTFAQGEYLMYLDSDDKTYPHSFEYCVAEMIIDKNVDVGMICYNTDLHKKIFFPKEAIKYHFFNQQILVIGPGGHIFKTSFFKSTGGFVDKYEVASDMYFNLLYASKGTIKCLTKNFLYYRLHDGQAMNNKIGYIVNNYLYLRDALLNLDLGLTTIEVNYLFKKNKRRFILNTFYFFLKNKKFSIINTMYKKANFTVKDFYEGVFHYFK